MQKVLLSEGFMLSEGTRSACKGKQGRGGRGYRKRSHYRGISGLCTLSLPSFSPLLWPLLIPETPLDSSSKIQGERKAGCSYNQTVLMGPTFSRKISNQEAAVQWTFHLEGSKGCSASLSVFAHSYTKRIPQILPSRNEAMPLENHLYTVQ